MSETWVSIPGFAGLYEVSDCGNIRSLDRRVPLGNGLRFHKGTDLVPRSLKSGHLYVTLSRESVPFTARIHRMVLLAFVGPCPDGMEGCHNDGNPANNHLPNLRWDTPASNQRDSVRHGTQVNARKMECKQGHRFSPANTYRHRGQRFCRECMRASARAYRKRLKATSSSTK